MTLPAPLAPLAAYRRFVTYELIPDPDRPGKTIKRPTHAVTGHYCKVNNPASWSDYATAAATGRPVGFVFCETDGFWFLDIDNALHGGAWSPLAVELCTELAGAAVEVSQSNTGLHIIGRGTVPAHSCKNVILGLELYTDARFVALTGLQAQGDASLDLTAAIGRIAAKYFPPNAHGEIAGWTDTPVDEWAGPTDDAALLKAALASGKKGTAAAFDPRHVTFEDLWTADADKLAAKWPSDKGGYDASQADAALAAHLAFWTGKNCERIRDLMLQSELARQKWEERPEWLETTIMRACAVTSNVAKGKPPAAPHSEQVKSVIIVNPGELDRIATEAERALIAAKITIYQRGDLVTPVINEVAASGGHKTKVVRLVPVTIPAMLDYLCRSTRFVKFSPTKGVYVPANPPENLAKIILARAGEWTFPHLAGVITAPTLRPDGSLLAEPGYDLHTRLLLIDPPVMATIPDNPTREDAVAALATLVGLLSDFPFADDSSRSVALSALISPVVRGAMLVVPLHAISAPTSGSGKTYLVDMVSALLTGDRAPVLSAADKVEETDKRLAGAVLDGSPIVALDNINGELYSDFLCQAVERPRVKIRPLGTSQLITVESRATFFATGNNLRLVSDLARRTLTCTLDPGLERPELRTFNRNPLGIVLTNRGEYLSAALIVVRAYVVAGQPGKARALGSFEVWSDLVRSALIWLGCADPVATQDGARADDPTVTELSALLTEWHAVGGSNPHTAKGIIEIAAPLVSGGISINAGLRDALAAVAADNRGGIDPLRLGKYLGRHKGRILAELRFVSEPDLKRKQNVWRVVTAG